MSINSNESDFEVRIEVKGSEINIIELVVKCVEQMDSVSKYESMLTVNGMSEKSKWITSDIRLLEDHFLLCLQKLLNQYNPENDDIRVLIDTRSLLALQSAYCQHCGKKLYEVYGQAYGVVKKCPNCGKFSFYRSRK